MNKYVGKICPYCKTEFKVNDEIVVCSECEMPHHKDCWIDNQGCTTFGCDGTIKSPENGTNSVTAKELSLDLSDNPSNQESYVYCTKCGAKNFSGSAFCCKCGSPIQSVSETILSSGPQYTQAEPNGNPYSYVQQGYYPNSSFASSTGQYSGSGYGQSGMGMDSDIALLVGKNKEYYIPKFNELKTQNKKGSWNWCAFLFTPYWMIYRKMYGYGAAVLGGMFLCSLLGSIFSIIALAGYVAFGILGNSIYMNFLEKKTGQMSMFDGQYKADYAAKNGGTNTTATVLTVIGYAILLTIIQAA